MPKTVILITGASQGIGAAIAKTFARELKGARLALVARSARLLLDTRNAFAARGVVPAEGRFVKI